MKKLPCNAGYSKGLSRLYPVFAWSHAKIKRDGLQSASPPFEISLVSCAELPKPLFSGFGSDITLASMGDKFAFRQILFVLHSSLFEVLCALWIVICSSSNNIIMCMYNVIFWPSIFFFKELILNHGSISLSFWLPAVNDFITNRG